MNRSTRRRQALRSWAALTAAILPMALGSGCDSGVSVAETDTGGVDSLPTMVMVTALGRLEPRNPIVRISGPSRTSVVIAEILVAEDQRVEARQPIAVLDSRAENAARVVRAQAQLTFAQREYDRVAKLLQQRISAESQRDEKQLALDIARSDLAAAQAALEMDTVRAPARGQIVALHARRGERVGDRGIAELAENDQMYAVAEVYETDIARVAVGQRARIHSPALESDLSGTVEKIGSKVGKLDLLDTDPVARTDARVVQVRIKLDESDRAAGLSNLQVDVSIEPSASGGDTAVK